MSIFNTISNEQSTFTLGASVQEMLRNSLTTSTAAPDAVARDAVAISSEAAAIVANAQNNSGETSILAGNFVSAGSEESEYIAAAKKNFTINMTLSNQKDNAIASMMETVMATMQQDSGNKYVEAVKGAIEAQMAAKREMNSKIAEASSETLDKAKADIEQAAEEATQPTDAAGQPMDAPPAAKPTSANANATPAPTGETQHIQAASVAATEEAATAQAETPPAMQQNITPLAKGASVDVVV
ncbi:MAG: hypothetical protein AB7E47_17615 [Desulfovibrionaceae bacterium]